MFIITTRKGLYLPLRSAATVYKGWPRQSANSTPRILGRHPAHTTPRTCQRHYPRITAKMFMVGCSQGVSAPTDIARTTPSQP